MRLWLDWFRHSSYKAAQAGSNPAGRTIFKCSCFLNYNMPMWRNWIAQVSSKDKVEGSNPSVGTIFVLVLSFPDSSVGRAVDC